MKLDTSPRTHRDGARSFYASDPEGNRPGTFSITPLPADFARFPLITGRPRKLAKRPKFEQAEMSLVRTCTPSWRRANLSCSAMGARVITRVDTSFPEEETTVQVWMKGADGPGLAKVNAKTITEVSEKKTA